MNEKKKYNNSFNLLEPVKKSHKKAEALIDIRCQMLIIPLKNSLDTLSLSLCF